MLDMEKNAAGTLHRAEQLILSLLPDAELELIDESHLHAGHGGHNPNDVSHMRVRIKSELLTPLSRVAQHRKINEALKSLMDNPIHALAIEVKK